MNQSERNRLLRMLVKHSLSFAPVTLSSGKSSNYYVDGKMTATTPEGAPLIADAIKDAINAELVDSVGGITMGADPMLGALSGKGYFRTFIVRKEAKPHGKSKYIEGQLNKDDKRVVFIDDVATTGGSILRGLEVLRREYPHIEIVKVIVLVDREEGAKENLKKHGYVLESIFTSKELIEEKKKQEEASSRCKKAA